MSDSEPVKKHGELGSLFIDLIDRAHPFRLVLLFLAYIITHTVPFLEDILGRNVKNTVGVGNTLTNKGIIVVATLLVLFMAILNVAAI